MSTLTYFSTPGNGVLARDKHGYSEAVLVGDRLELAGQAGRSPQTGAISPHLPTAIQQTFANISAVIKHALGLPETANGWDRVFKVTSYHVGCDDATAGLMTGAIREWCGAGHRPVWTMVGVERLAKGDMKVEVEVVAWAGGDVGNTKSAEVIQAS